MGGVADRRRGVLPGSRRIGLAAPSPRAGREALRRSVQSVFLAASDNDVAPVYARLGFGRVGAAMIAEPGD